MELLFKGLPHFQEYHNQTISLHVVAGSIVDVSDEVGKKLKADFPGIFVEKQKTLPLTTADMTEAAKTRQIINPKKRK